MPPDGRLSPADIATLTTWVKLGAPDPRTEARSVSIRPHRVVNIEQGRQFWAFQRPTQQPLPIVQNITWPAGWN